MKKNIIVKMRDYDIDVITNGVDNFDKVVICFHGFNGDKWGDAYSGLKHLATNSLVCSFNSCGHGDSEVLSEDMRLDMVLREIDVVIERIRKLTENRPIILVGVSYGGYRVMQYLIKK